MVQNFMDLSYDGCMNVFTKGQCAAMRRVLFEQRAGLIHDASVVTGVEEEVAGAELYYRGGQIFKVETPGALTDLEVVDVLGRKVPFQWVERGVRDGLVVVPVVSGVLMFRVYHGQGVTVRKLIVL